MKLMIECVLKNRQKATSRALGEIPPHNTMRKSVRRRFSLGGSVLNRDGSQKSDNPEQHSRLNSQNVRPEPLSNEVSDGIFCLLFNKIDD